MSFKLEDVNCGTGEISEVRGNYSWENRLKKVLGDRTFCFSNGGGCGCECVDQFFCGCHGDDRATQVCPCECDREDYCCTDSD